MPSASRADTAVPVLLGVGLGVYLVVHFLSPDFSMTWSYAHLDRRPWLAPIGLGLVFLLPLLGLFAWRSSAFSRPLQPLSRGFVFVGSVVLFLALLGSVYVFPQEPYAVDAFEFLFGSTQPDFHYNPRWYLSIRTYRLISKIFVPPLPPEAYARGANVLLGTISLLALAGCARSLTKTRGEALALTLLVWTSFGVLQIAWGYLDIYPVPLAATSVYLWLALRTLEGRTGLLWPLLVVGLGPFLYIGLILLAPSALFLAFDTYRRHGMRAVVTPLLLTLALMVLATIPAHGRPLAWAAWYGEAAQASSCQWGFRSDSCLLPLDYMFGTTHLAEMIHLLVLVDGVGLLFFLVCTSREFIRDPRTIDLRMLVLGSIGAGHFAFLLVLDPLFGPYSDWDAYTYSMIPLTLLGGWGFLTWSRRSPRAAGLLFGLALAAASVHLLARLNAMHVDYHRHIAETPCHVNCGARGSYYESCRGCRWDGTLLLCECQATDGTWRKTGTMERCPSGYQNLDGHLRCAGG